MHFGKEFIRKSLNESETFDYMSTNEEKWSLYKSQKCEEFAESVQICSAVTVTRCMRGTESTENPVETPLDHPFGSKAMQ